VYPEKWTLVLSVKPGITDNASIMFYNEEELLSRSPDPEEFYRNIILPKKLDLYIDYINNQSLGEDIKIIFRTLKAISLR
jgi:lipopolysaccharide/colanic/teichoic acid biosynthesis glycosyltransferase